MHFAICPSSFNCLLMREGVHYQPLYRKVVPHITKNPVSYLIIIARI